MTGTDFSARMIAEARARVPEAMLIEADLRATTWPPTLDGPFEAITSAYVLHEFALDTKVAILARARERLAPGGRIVIGDVAFATRADHDAARIRWSDRWDHDEHYWAADEALAAAAEAGLDGSWKAMSRCAGVFIFTPRGGVDPHPGVPHLGT